MKKYILLLLLPISVFAASDNYFCASGGNLSFTENEIGTCSDANGNSSDNNKCHKITSGQSWGGISTKNRCVLVKADRKYSTPVLNWIYQNSKTNIDQYRSLSTIEPLSRTGTCINNCAPKDLNFATQGTLHISGLLNTKETIDCNNIILAQGSYETAGGFGARTNISWIITNMEEDVAPQKNSVILSCNVADSTQGVDVEVTRNTGKNAAETFTYKVINYRRIM